MINLGAQQSRQANDIAGIVKRAKERDFAIVKCYRKRSKRPNRNAKIQTYHAKNRAFEEKQSKCTKFLSLLF